METSCASFLIVNIHIGFYKTKSLTYFFDRSVPQLFLCDLSSSRHIPLTIKFQFSVEKIIISLLLVKGKSEQGFQFHMLKQNLSLHFYTNRKAIYLVSNLYDRWSRQIHHSIKVPPKNQSKNRREEKREYNYFKKAIIFPTKMLTWIEQNYYTILLRLVFDFD